MARHVLTLLVLVLLLPVPAATAAQSAPAPAPLTAEELPVSLERIRQQLREVPAEEREGLRLSYYVDVYGRAPTEQIFANYDLHNGPVPYGGPTHRDILDLVTPREFRSPPADLTKLFEWLASIGSKKP